MIDATPPVRVIGVGNRWRGDDAVGLEAVRQLGPTPARVSVSVHEGDGSGLLELWHGARAVILVDAMRSGAAPGSVHRFEAGTKPLPRAAANGSIHAVGIPEAIELARSLGRLPATVVVYAVEGTAFAAGADMSEPVAAAISDVAGRVVGEASELAGGDERD